MSEIEQTYSDKAISSTLSCFAVRATVFRKDQALEGRLVGSERSDGTTVSPSELAILLLGRVGAF